ncbi:MAG: hypothetical protein EOP53_20690 [Sphingobacteriales bacterium]|nr:MAG: hypothetical protein EOP53_20690 [Sphingobacteriales bacterium]
MNNKTLNKVLIAIAIPTAYAVAMRYIFGYESWKEIFAVMSGTFLFLLPTIMGILTVYLLPQEKAKKVPYQIFIPWIPIFLFLIITLMLNIEGWACWIMILPIFLIAASVGGVIGGHLKVKKRNDRLNISVLILIPLLISPIENFIGSVQTNYKADTFIDINAPAEKIWQNVTRVRAIPKSDDKGYLTSFLGFPRPVKAELNFNGVGAHREAIFTKGLVFHEDVIEYTANKKMVFTIKAFPYEIPSTTMDKHVVIGGDYFDVLNGTYEIEPLPNAKNRLHLYSIFKIRTTFNFYAGWWAKWIMKDIQNNILQIEKTRSELP